MADEKRYIAVDLGAESGRIMLGSVSDEKIRLEEIHRFMNHPFHQDESLRWDFQKIISEIKTGIAKAVKKSSHICGIGVDSWGVDFGLLDEKGNLIENPYHYRDKRTNGIMEKAFELMPKRDIYENTGIQFMQLNTAYQLLAMQLSNSPVLKNAKKLIFMADLVSYFLCGRPYAEYSLASTSQLMDMRRGIWSKPIFEKLNLPIEIMPEIIQAGTVVGTLKKNIADEIASETIPVIAVGSHDTASAVAAIGADEKTNWAYLSSGTWSLMGVESPTAVINDKTFEFAFTNEGSADGKIRLLKNIMGLWLIQECKKQWQKEGTDLSYEQLTSMAAGAKPVDAAIDIDNACFLAPGDMPQRINEYLIKSGQKPVSDKAQIVRILLESLARKYKETINQLEDVTSHPIDCLHIVGGGCQNELLNQLTADITAKKVIAGPVEATALGNILLQAKAAGQIRDLAEGRKLVRDSFTLKEFSTKSF